MFIVAQLYSAKDDRQSLMSEALHPTIDSALADYNERITSGYRNLIIARILPVKTVIVDYDAAGVIETPIGGDR